ncbi:MAG: NUDIX domain-containing protein, partial [Planctomycetes bacterium]|nr:NUDIX domain-containing protein [Planctomycetota bacterium]
AQELPHARARRAPLAVELEIFVVEEGRRVLLTRRPETGRMAGLLEFPTRERVANGRARLWPEDLPGLVPAAGMPLGELAHTITHHRIRVSVRGARLRGRRLPDGACWVERRGLAELALTGLARKVLALISARGRAGTAGVSSSGTLDAGAPP